MRLPVLILALAAAACGHVSPSRGPVAPAPAPVAAPAPALPPESSPPAPIAIDTDGGISVGLDALSVQVDVHGPLARTEIHATFRNNEPREVEGRLRLALPPRSALARVAMKVGPDWREAEVAELTAARMTYDRFLHRRRDPLLVEQRREREVTARVAPLSPFEHREIIVAFTSEVSAESPVIVPLRGLSELRTLDVRVDGIADPVHKHWARTTPEADLRVPVGASAVRAGNLVAVRVTPVLIAEPEEIEGPVVILMETTASHAGDLASYARLVETIGADTDASGAVIAYDQTAETLHRGGLRGAPIADRLVARGALGAASLDVGLAEAAQEARRIGARRLIILGGNAPLLDDGKGRRAELLAAGIERVDVLGVGALPDARSYLALLDLHRTGAWVDDAPALTEGALMRRLQNRVHANVPVRIDGATWSSATSFPRVSPGDERVVLAQVAPRASLRVNGDTYAPSDDATAGPTLERAVASAKLDALVARGAKKEAVALARAHRLVSPWTALIVLERDEDTALLREDERAGVPPPGPKPPLPRPPVLRMGSVQVSARLPPEVIQRQIHLKIGLFRGCVEEAARRTPGLVGRVIVHFVIGHDGTVVDARDAGSDVADPKLVACMIQGFLKLELPPSESSTVHVIYPFNVGDPELPSMPMSFGWRLPRMRSPFLETTNATEEVVEGPWCTLYADLRARPDAPLGHTPTTVIALGDALNTKGNRDRAARAFGSLADLWPERAEMLRAAAVRLDHLRAGDPWAITLLRRAVADRPDHPSGHHLLGLTLLRARDEVGARAAFTTGLARGYERRYDGAEALLRRDLALLEPTVAPNRSVVMSWETDTSDLDVSVTDAKGEPSGGDAFARAREGYGPEGLEPAPGGKELHVRLVQRGLGGDVFGVVHVIKRNERGDVTVEPRPFAIMTERATLDLGPI